MVVIHSSLLICRDATVSTSNNYYYCKPTFSALLPLSRTHTMLVKISILAYAVT